MKVLLIDVNCKNSSTGKIVYDLFSYLNKNGDEAAVCYGRGKLINEKNIYKFGVDCETYFHALLTRVTGFTGCFSFLSTRRLINYIEKYNPDIVHIHELHAYFVNIKPLIEYLKKKHIKTVMTLHCEFAYTGKCGHSVDCEKWKSGCKKCPHLHDYVSTIFFDHTKYMWEQKKKLFYNFDELSIVTPSKWLAERAKQSLLKTHDIRVIHNGIDTNTFSPQKTEQLRSELKIDKDEKVILALAPHIMSANKGGEYILRMANVLKDKKIHFILVGADGVLVDHKENVTLCGPIYDKKQIATYYSLADAFVICSERENFPTTCLEAQSCGTPIYGFNTGGTMETSLEKHSKNFVEYGDIHGLIDLLLKCDKKEKEQAQQIHKDTCILFGKEKYLIQTYKLYQEKNGR